MVGRRNPTSDQPEVSTSEWNTQYKLWNTCLRKLKITCIPCYTPWKWTQPSRIVNGKRNLHSSPYCSSTAEPYLALLGGQLRERDAFLKARQKKNFDKRDLAKNLSDLSPLERVWLPVQRVEGTVLNKAGTPRSYARETPNGGWAEEK